MWNRSVGSCARVLSSPARKQFWEGRWRFNSDQKEEELNPVFPFKRSYDQSVVSKEKDGKVTSASLMPLSFLHFACWSEQCTEFLNFSFDEVCIFYQNLKKKKVSSGNIVMKTIFHMNQSMKVEITSLGEVKRQNSKLKKLI